MSQRLWVCGQAGQERRGPCQKKPLRKRRSIYINRPIRNYSTNGHLTKTKSERFPRDSPYWRLGNSPAGRGKSKRKQRRPLLPTLCSGCRCATCVELLVAQGFQYEYPDLVIRIHQGAGATSGQVGVVFGMKDLKSYYAAVVDLSQKAIEVVRVIDGKESVLGRAVLKVKPVEWHTLRVQRNTIISKDFVETVFDGSLALSVEDQALGVGQVGLVMRGETSAHFDNFNAAPLYSSRPLSAPAAY